MCVGENGGSTLALGGGGCSFLLSASDFVEMRGKVGSSRLLFVRSGGSASSSTISMMCEVAHCSM